MWAPVMVNLKGLQRQSNEKHVLAKIESIAEIEIEQDYFALNMSSYELVSRPWISTIHDNITHRVKFVHKANV